MTTIHTIPDRKPDLGNGSTGPAQLGDVPPDGHDEEAPVAVATRWSGGGDRHNTQAWVFHVSPQRIDVFADGSRNIGAEQGRAPILIRRDNTTEDLAGMIVAAGLLTATGGRTSHAAVVMREMAMPCVAGAAGIEIDLARRRVSIGGREFAEGDQISIDGESDRVFADTVQIDDERPTANLATVASWPATNGAA